MTKSYIKGPDAPEIGQQENLLSTLWKRAEEAPNREILQYREGQVWRSMNWAQIAERVRELAAGLVAMGVEQGDRVALISSTRIEWTLCDYAILAAGGVTVPIYDTSSTEQCAWILSDSGAKHAIAANADLAKRLDEARSEAAGLGEVLVLDEGALDTIAERGDEASRQALDQRDAATGPDALASIIYTSGTTGRPKGCVLTHNNLLATARGASASLSELFTPEDRTLLFLPLAHSFARIIQCACVENDVTLGYAPSIENLRDDLASFQPTFLLAVPRVFEKVFNGAQRNAGGGLKGKIFSFAVSAGQEWASADSPGLVSTLKRTVADKLVYSKLRAAMGGRLQYCISGGAPLAPHIAYFFKAAGVEILEGYGLTETSAGSVVNPPRANKIGTVGRPLAGVEIQIDDGEVLLRSPGVFKGYWRNEEATKESLTDEGWFRTGDLGELDGDGYLKITGRKKELIVTAGGKNVSPAVLEERLKANRLVSQAMVVGDNRPFVGALISIDPDELKAFAEENGLTGDDLSEHPRVLEELQRAVDHANAAVSKAESIRKYTVVERDFTEDAGELTPTMKVKRPVVADHFSHKVEELYTG